MAKVKQLMTFSDVIAHYCENTESLQLIDVAQSL